MGIKVNTNCSECYHQEEMDLDLRQDEIKCGQCGHSVPMLEDEDYYDIERDQKKRETLGYAAMGAFVAVIVCFYLMYLGMEPAALHAPGNPPGEEPGGMIWMILMLVGALGALVLGCMASSKKVICEY